MAGARLAWKEVMDELELVRRCDVEGDTQPLADAERPRTVPHRGRKEDKPAGLRLDQANGRQIEMQLGLRLAQRQPAARLRTAIIDVGQRDIEGRAEPAGG